MACGEAYIKQSNHHGPRAARSCWLLHPDSLFNTLNNPNVRVFLKSFCSSIEFALTLRDTVAMGLYSKLADDITEVDVIIAGGTHHDSYSPKNLNYVLTIQFQVEQQLAFSLVVSRPPTLNYPFSSLKAAPTTAMFPMSSIQPSSSTTLPRRARPQSSTRATYPTSWQAVVPLSRLEESSVAVPRLTLCCTLPNLWPSPPLPSMPPPPSSTLSDL